MLKRNLTSKMNPEHGHPRNPKKEYVLPRFHQIQWVVPNQFRTLKKAKQTIRHWEH